MLSSVELRCSPSYDLELPVECDDEYWDLSDPQTAWKQPPGSPSYVAYFNILIKLYDILGFTLRTIVSFVLVNPIFQLLDRSLP